MFKKVLITGLSAFITCNSFAVGSDEIFPQETPWVWQPVITLSGGPAWTTLGLTQVDYPPAPFPTTSYFPNKKSQTIGSGEVFFGLQRVLTPRITGQLGLGAAAAGDARVAGTFLVNGIPASNTFTYQYDVNHMRIELKGKLIGNFNKTIQPYISGSFGMGWNQSHGYSETSLDPINFPTVSFLSNTTTAMPYSVGAGLQAMLNQHWQVGVGYEFADLGKSKLGVNGLTLIQGPYLDHFYTNELLFSLSYLY